MAKPRNKRAIAFIMVLVVFVFAYIGFRGWFYGDGKPLTESEIDTYLKRIEANMTKDRTGRELQSTSLANFRKFAQEDDGKPFFMVNLIRENKNPIYPSDWTGAKAKTVHEAKELYSSACKPFLFKNGSYAVVDVTYSSPEVVNSGVDVEDWDQFYLVRYKSRRVFLELLASDFYANAVVHKYACDKDTLLIPVTTASATDMNKNIIIGMIIILLVLLEIMGGFRKVFNIKDKEKKVKQIEKTSK